MMERITVDDVVAWEPCDDYYTDRAYLLGITGDREALTPFEVLDLEIPIQHRFWVLLRPEVIPSRDLRLLVCEFAERVLPVWEGWAIKNNRKHLTAPAWLVEVARRYAEGEETEERLVSAIAVVRGFAYALLGSELARFAAKSALCVGELSRDQELFSIANRCRAVTRVAAAATWRSSAEEEWQLNRLRRYFEEAA